MDVSMALTIIVMSAGGLDLLVSNVKGNKRLDFLVYIKPNPLDNAKTVLTHKMCSRLLAPMPHIFIPSHSHVYSCSFYPSAFHGPSVVAMPAGMMDPATTESAARDIDDRDFFTYGVADTMRAHSCGVARE